eukprot:CAMPEP_0197243310 /NCGR_PEP_ID=MMETSP1429-20130617/8807_1 /TAXON_ID=49237 /ORGANISM="Chaetoceros  sp., Strain UNC1202" /LENGTH=193 /DNA_ID=CAMNT_0042703513 /DNA_START=91 /DNA_END=672 /DNA_ORIENTATION=+
MIPRTIRHSVMRTYRRSDIATSSHASNTKNGIDDPVHVTFETATQTKTIPIQNGEILRSAMLKRGISPHNGKSRLINCRGLGTCGTCAVEITSGSGNSPDDSNGLMGVEPTERNTKERMRLNFPPHGSEDQSSNLRLACQVQVNGDVHVTKRGGFWGSSEELAEEYEAELYFNELEYILDNKSPEDASSPLKK